MAGLEREEVVQLVGLQLVVRQRRHRILEYGICERFLADTASDDAVEQRATLFVRAQWD